jgi:hypothetical protein
MLDLDRPAALAGVWGCAHRCLPVRAAITRRPSRPTCSSSFRKEANPLHYQPRDKKSAF